jgi:hypothetical protein
MPEKLDEKRFCGNCSYHHTYEYPDLIFCFRRFEEEKNAIFPILDHCEYWELQSEGCFCLRDALEAKSGKIGELH